MRADEYLLLLARELQGSAELDAEIASLVVDMLFREKRERDVALLIESQIEKIAMRRASRKPG